MNQNRYAGMLGDITEASDIHAETGCTVEEAFEVQSHLAAHRQQEYLDAVAEIVADAHEEYVAASTTIGNVVFGVPFGQPKPKEATHGTL